MSRFGSVEPFDLANGNFVEYIERLNQYFLANDINDNTKKRAIFITVIGNELYSLVRSLLAPAQPANTSYDNLVTTLSNHLTPKPVIIAERYKFYERKQYDDESISEFVASLRKLAIKCAFGDFLNDALRDRLVCGMKDSRIRKRLLIEQDLTLTKAIDISKSLEGVELEVKEMDDNSRKVKVEDAFKLQQNFTRKKKCYRCGDESHMANECRFKSTVCNTCNIRGHISRACRSKNKSRRSEPVNNVPSDPGVQSSHTPVTQSTGAEEKAEVYHIHHINAKTNPYRTVLNVNGKNLEFEIYTGAGVTIISKDTYEMHLQEFELLPTVIKIRTYSNEPLRILGKIEVTVELHHTATLYVIDGRGTSLLGRDWLMKVKLNWADILQKHVGHSNSIINNCSVTNTLNDILRTHKALFENRIGRMKGYKAKLSVKGDATAKFSKARTVPFALQDAVAKEIERLESEGVLKSVPFSDWASPIVVIPKADGAIRICGDYKNTVNPQIESFVYPTPSNDEVFSKMRGGSSKSC